MTKLRKRSIKDYASKDEDGNWFWLPSAFEKYTERQLMRIKKRYYKKGYQITIGKNLVLDLYKRVAELEKRK